MKSILRVAAAVLAGLIVSFVLIVAVELFSSVVHPVPADFGGTQEEMCRHVERYPAWVLAVAVPAWTATGFVGAWTARRIGGRVSAAIVGILLFAGMAFNVAMLPYPIWFKIACLVAIPCALMYGIRTPAKQLAAA